MTRGCGSCKLFKFLCHRLLCVIGLHSWVPQIWDFDMEKTFHQMHGHLPPLYAYCWYCVKKRELAR